MAIQQVHDVELTARETIVQQIVQCDDLKTGQREMPHKNHSSIKMVHRQERDSHTHDVVYVKRTISFAYLYGVHFFLGSYRLLKCSRISILFY